MAGWARCNRDGRPLHPGDQAIMDQFTTWLAMGPGERHEQIAGIVAWLDLPPEQRAQVPEPEWRAWLGITEQTVARARAKGNVQ